MIKGLSHACLKRARGFLFLVNLEEPDNTDGFQSES